MRRKVLRIRIGAANLVDNRGWGGGVTELDLKIFFENFTILQFTNKSPRGIRTHDIQIGS